MSEQVETAYHIVTFMQQATLCGIAREQLPPNTPIITLYGYKRGTELTICEACKESYKGAELVEAQ